MEYQIQNKNFIFNKEKNIGNVLYIVEGASREIKLIGHIFEKILGYQFVVGIDRDGVERYVSPKNANSKIFIINSEKSNIRSMTNMDFIDEQAKKLRQYYPEFNYENIPIYYIFDCDRPNDLPVIPSLINLYGNSRESCVKDDYDSTKGMLLLSYPAIESFVISNFEKDMIHFYDRSPEISNGLKAYISTHGYSNDKMSLESLCNSFEELLKSLSYIGINQIDLDDIRKESQLVFDYELEQKNRYLLSMLLISFLDLGIIEIK